MASETIDRMDIRTEMIYDALKKGLPKALRKALDKRRAEIKTVDDIGRVLDEIFARCKQEGLYKSSNGDLEGKCRR